MKGQRPSRTAHFVAFGRAIADLGLSHIPDFRDPTARVFLNEKGQQSIAKIEQELEIHIHDARDVFGPLDIAGHPVEGVGDAGKHL